MLTKTVDVGHTSKSLKDLLALAASGTQVIFVADGSPVARLLPMGQRVPGLHLGAIQTSDDFDSPLPDQFWAGEE